MKLKTTAPAKLPRNRGPLSDTDTYSRRPAQGRRVVGKLIAKRFRVQRRLGKGGNADVYEARDMLSGRQVALKMPRGCDSCESLLEEAAVASSLAHRHSVDVYLAGVTGRGFGFVAMELIDGPSLAAVMEKTGPMCERRVVLLGLEMCEAIQELHDAAMAHCDIKPANLMMRRVDRSLVLIDFGLATRFGEPIGGDGDFEGIRGTPAYLSPEQALGYAVDARTDIYSLGCVFYAMLAGHTPYPAKNSVAAVCKHVGAPIPEVDAPRVSTKLRELIESMMQKDPDSRPASMRCVAAALKRVMSDMPARPPTRFARAT